MSEMTLHPDEGGSTNISPLGEKQAAPVASFRTFPLRFDEFAFTHWYLFTLGLARILKSFLDILLSRNQSILLGAMFIICLALTWGNILGVYASFCSYSFLLPQSPLFGLLGMVQTLLHQVVRTILAVFLEGYIFVAGSWVLAVTGKYLKDL